MTLKQRYVTGLEKLDFASSQVSVMQQELSDLQPELIKTSAETEKLMVKIEQDTVEVEAKKEVRLISLAWIAFFFRGEVERCFPWALFLEVVPWAAIFDLKT